LIAGWSGFNVMAIELLSGRMLAPSFGNSIYVWGGVITIFMLALSVGYLLGGRLSVGKPSLRILSFLLLAVAAAIVPTILLGDVAMNSVFALVEDPRYGSLLSSAALFFVPTVISGMISPYAVRLLVNEYKTSGHYAGLLFFVSTFGSAAGTILTSFYLVMYLEINQIFLFLIGISTVIGVLSLIAGRKYVPLD
jgi:MFS family permease